MRKFYVDTSVWLDLAFDRKDNVRPLGELAFQFFKKCMRNGWKILYSELVLDELSKKMDLEEIPERCFGIISKKEVLMEVKFSLKQAKEAREISKKKGVPFADAMHAVVARDNKAMFISRDFHFQELSGIVTCLLPEDV